MNELLELAVKAHGGLARWNEVSPVEIDVSITGAIWYVKRRPDVLKPPRPPAPMPSSSCRTSAAFVMASHNHHYRSQAERSTMGDGVR